MPPPGTQLCNFEPPYTKPIGTAEYVECIAISQTTNSMHASAVRAVFGLLLLVLCFVADDTHQYVYVLLAQLAVFFNKCGNDCSEHNVT